MFESKYSKVLTIGLIVGIAVIVIALLFLGFKLIQNYYINKDAENAVERFQGEVFYNDDTPEDNTEVTNVISPTLEIENLLINNNSNNNNQKMYKGFPMVGTIEIPAINLKYPVLADASSKAIKVAVGIFYPEGATLNEIGNTVIAGHNYRNGTFFSNNKKLVNGDKIYITDNSGRKIAYTIYNIYTTSPEDSDFLVRDTQGKREISLTTCTDDSKSRLIIWAKED